MSLLGEIIEAIFAHPSASQPPAPSQNRPPLNHPSRDDAPAPTPPSPPPAGSSSPSTAPSSGPAPVVDIDAVMTALAGERGEKLDWKHSVVDLLKAVGLDSSRSARLRLAEELHYAGDRHDSAAMNEWLHDAVLKAIVDNGGKLPADL